MTSLNKNKSLHNRQILIQAQILAHCSHKYKNAVQSSQIVLHFLNTGGFFIFCQTA